MDESNFNLPDTYYLCGSGDITFQELQNVSTKVPATVPVNVACRAADQSPNLEELLVVQAADGKFQTAAQIVG